MASQLLRHELCGLTLASHTRQGTAVHLGRHRSVALVSLTCHGLAGRALLQCRAQPRRPLRAAAITAQSVEAPPADALRVEESDLPECRRQLTVTVPPVRCAAAWTAALAQAAAEADLDGFRKTAKGKSKISAELLLKLVGVRNVKAIAVEKLLQDATATAMQRHEERALSDSFRIDSNSDQLVAAFNPATPFTFQCSFDLPPQLTWAQPYRDLQVTVEEPQAGGEALVEQQVAALRKERGTLRVAPGRGLRPGDMAIVDTQVTRLDTGEAVEGGSRAGLQLDTAGRPFLLGLVEGLVGAKSGEERSLAVTLPDDWQPAALAGLACQAAVKVTELFEWDLPQVDDEFAEAVAPGCGGVAGLRSLIESAVAADAEAARRQALHTSLMEAVVGAARCSVPDSLLREHAEREYSAKLLELQSEGKLTFQASRALATEEMLQNFIREQREELTTQLVSTIAIDVIAAEQGIEVSQAERDEEFASASQEFREQGQQFDEAKLAEQVDEFLKAQKTMRWLADNLAVTWVPRKTS